MHARVCIRSRHARSLVCRGTCARVRAQVWGLDDYKLVYSLPNDDVSEVKISPGVMLLIHTRQVHAHVHARALGLMPMLGLMGSYSSLG